MTHLERSYKNTSGKAQGQKIHNDADHDDDDDGSRSSRILQQHLVNIILFSESFHSKLSEMETKCDVSLQSFGPTYIGNAIVNTFILFLIL